MTRPSDVEKRWQAVPTAMGSVGFIIDANGVYREIIYDDDTEYQLYDDPETLQGKQLQEVLPEATAERFREGISRALATGDSQTIEYDLSVKGGHRWFVAHVAPISASNADDSETVLWLTDDITERQRYEKKLEKTTEQLEALNRVVRHDIRNDMTVIRGWSKQLQEHVSVDGQDALDRVLRKSHHVIELTEISRDFVESLVRDDVAEVKPVGLQQYLETELVTIRESYPNAQFDVSDEIPDVSVRANEMISSVFRNLFENAVQHNDEETPKIAVTYVDRGETVRVRIADNGPGIPDEQKEQIFGKGESALDSSGSGIGLYLVHTLTDQFGGDVWVEDNDPKGAVFIVELRKAEPATHD